MHDARYRCSRCGEDKPASEFSPDRRKASGLQARCKACGAEISRRWRTKNPDTVREQSRTKYARIRVERPEDHRQRIADWRLRNVDYANLMTRANLAVLRAIRRGEVVRPDACEHCGVTSVVEAHHEDHGKALQVDWLCRICHRAADKRRALDGRSRT